MNFTLQDFDFKVNTLTTVAEIDNLIEDYALRIKELEIKLDSRELQLDKSENRSENLGEDITEIRALIASKETELSNYVAGTRKHEDVAIELDGLKVKLRRLNFKKTETASPLSLVEKNLDTGEAELLLLYFTRFKEALEQRKTQL